MTRFGAPWALTATQPKAGTLLAAFYRCDNCMWPNAATGGDVPEHQGRPRTEESLTAPRHDESELTWYPETASGRTFDDVPEHIAGAADEAFKCRSFHALRSTILMARSVVEATCKERGISSGPLVKKVDALEQAGHIRAHIKDAAHEIRFLGNDMAHGEFTATVMTEEADEILEFMGEILHDVFQSPAKIARRKAAREERETRESPSS